MSLSDPKEWRSLKSINKMSVPKSIKKLQQLKEAISSPKTSKDYVQADEVRNIRDARMRVFLGIHSDIAFLLEKTLERFNAREELQAHKMKLIEDLLKIPSTQIDKQFDIYIKYLDDLQTEIKKIQDKQTLQEEQDHIISTLEGFFSCVESF